jgi:8-oxo-dGTP pyrophosphatase MutT (NUDIX family)
MSDIQEPPKMARGRKSTHSSRELPSEHFVESCGAILFDLSDPNDKKICIVKPSYSNSEWLLAKGRRNHGESRKDAAIREVMEETGFRCKILPVTMPTHTTPPEAHADFPDSTHVYEGLSEPFWCTIRELKKPKRTKIIWWYIAVLEDEDKNAEKLPGEEKFMPKFVTCDKALEMLTFQTDRDVVAKAIGLVNDTIFARQEPAETDKKAKATINTTNPKAANTSTNRSNYTIPRKRKKQEIETKVKVEDAHSTSNDSALRSQGVGDPTATSLSDAQPWSGDRMADHNGEEANMVRLSKKQRRRRRLQNVQASNAARLGGGKSLDEQHVKP